MCLISFIVPVYNLKKTEVEECIYSLLNQTSNDYEIIIVDDGSNNGIESYCDELEKQYRISVIHQLNQGLAVARNTGINAAKGKWIVHVDGDDWVDMHLAEALKDAEYDSIADIIVWGFTLANGTYRQNLLLEDKKAFEKPYDEIKDHVLCSILDCDESFANLSLNTSWAKAYRKTFITDCGLLYDSKLRRAQDAVYNLNAFNKAKKIEYIDRTLNYYRNDNLSLSRGYNPKTFEYLLLTANAVSDFVDKKKVSKIVKSSSNVFIQRCFRMTASQVYIHKDNPLPYRQRKEMFKEAINTEPYRGAFNSGMKRNGLLFKLEDYLYQKQNFCCVTLYSYLFHFAYSIKKALVNVVSNSKRK